MPVNKIWEELGHVPTDENDCIEIQFLDLITGTHREDSWQWIEQHYDISIVELMGIE